MGFQTDAFQDNQFGFQVEFIGNVVFIAEGDSLVVSIFGDSDSIMFGGSNYEGPGNYESPGVYEGQEGEWNWDSVIVSTSIEGG